MISIKKIYKPNKYTYAPQPLQIDTRVPFIEQGFQLVTPIFRESERADLYFFLSLSIRYITYLMLILLGFFFKEKS